VDNVNKNLHIDIDKKKYKEIAKIVLMTGDPLRAKFIAHGYLSQYSLLSNLRNMSVYSGYYDINNEKVKVIAAGSGMGCPSMGIYSKE
jgi:purine-nucleoside phosphorylase